MIWGAFALLAVAVVLGIGYLASRTRSAIATLRDQTNQQIEQLQDENHALREQAKSLQAASERARNERKKINTRAAGRLRLSEANREGVQDAKDRSASVRKELAERLSRQSSIVNELRDLDKQRSSVLIELRNLDKQRGAALTATRLEVQKLREQLRAQDLDAKRDGAPAESPINNEINRAARTKPSIKEALDRLEAVAAATAPSTGRAIPAPAPIDLTKLLVSGEPSVTVVVTNYNDEAFLEDCLTSLQKQTLPEFECIVVDDASTDGSPAIAHRFAGEDPRFRVIVHEENQGPSTARNSGLAQAKAPFIAFLDSDDLLLSQSLEQRLFTLLQATRASVAGVFSGIEHRPMDVRLEDLPPELPWNGSTRRDFVSTQGECPFNMHAPLLRTDIVRRSGGFDESMRFGAEDWELWLRLMRNGYVFEPCTTTLGIYRQKPQSLVRSHPAKHLSASSELLESVQSEANPESRMGQAPFFYDQPLSHYEQAELLAQRGYQYLALAALTGDDHEIETTIDTLPTNLGASLAQTADRSSQLLAGLRRGLGLSSEDFVHVLPEARVVCDNLLEQSMQTLPQPVIVFPTTRDTTSPPLRLFYWKAADGVRGAGNFGDELSPLLVELASGRSVERAEVSDCNVIALGSILDLTVGESHNRPAIWGSGFIRAGETTGAGLNIHAVRGHLTNERCGSVGSVGDPALLARFLDIPDAMHYRVGLLPHYVDWDLPFVAEFASRIDGATLIDPLQPPLDVLAQIAACDVIFSSSLHGLICADSLGVPNAWVELSDGVVGGGYKFLDYYSCFDLPARALRPSDPVELDDVIGDVISGHKRPHLDALCAGLLDAFPTHL